MKRVSWVNSDARAGLISFHVGFMVPTEEDTLKALMMSLEIEQPRA